MTKLGLEAKDLEPTRTIFHGIVPGLSCSPTGRVRLDVMFRDSSHFRRKPIWFEVVDLSTAYHALLGRPALAKFMAGLITIIGDYRKSLDYARDGAKLAESLVIAEERRQLDRIVALAQESSAAQIPTEEPADEAAFKPSKETKKVKLNPEDPSCSKYVIVGTRLDNK
ncbi:uncharacterized protein [Aegilops tauschii subsp. strangulata]|uniref:uncharacterized protein n=1 Tax=Aegilops tauschii subsp. strangulata TaxID=200361 RepID=UPI00098A3BC2|nr:uncharacterized protein LOC109736479 [Aegilops tauschii subsp. strangulata]